MTKEEFTTRTGFDPTAAQWQEITASYQQFDWEDKDMFCRRWLRENYPDTWLNIVRWQILRRR